MKYLVFLLVAASLLPAMQSCQVPARAQNDSREVSPARVLNSRRFEFIPQTANPQAGGSLQSLNGFSLLVKGDTLVSYLPYYGRSFSGDIGSSRGPLDFRSTDFSLTTRSGKKNSVEAMIKPAEYPEVTAMTLTLFPGGYGSLYVTFRNRQSMSFYGEVR